jgi:hypothetical protein
VLGKSSTQLAGVVINMSPWPASSDRNHYLTKTRRPGKQRVQAAPPPAASPHTSPARDIVAGNLASPASKIEDADADTPSLPAPAPSSMEKPATTATEIEDADTTSLLVPPSSMEKPETTNQDTSSVDEAMGKTVTVRIPRVKQSNSNHAWQDRD